MSSHLNKSKKDFKGLKYFRCVCQSGEALIKLTGKRRISGPVTKPRQTPPGKKAAVMYSGFTAH